MTEASFESRVKERIELCLKILGKKGLEYHVSGNPVGQVEMGAAILGTDPEHYVLALMTKHLVSVMTNIKNKRYDNWEEKIGDLINYCLILDAVIQNKKEERK